MPSLTIYDSNKVSLEFPVELTAGKRRLTDTEIAVLEKNRNTSQFKDWKNVLVSAEQDAFDPNLIRDSRFEGFVVIGELKYSSLKYHDLELECGIVNSLVRNTVIGNYNVLQNVFYIENYRLGDRVILFNIQEMSCTKHSKFGNGIVKEGEPEANRVCIGVANENDGRAVLPFEKMITADAFLWSRNRSDKVLQQRFVELTEHDFSKELNTFGIVGNDVVIKNTTLIKDAKIGDHAYIKGAFKLKNVTILSTKNEPSQIGEGVEMVNGIMNSGSRIFYQAVAVRFVIGKNCQIKYGARLLNSVLGDNSTVSCCEILNNLIFPFHEQHHNSSFLIATTVMGQSNIAAGATIGSNHNSRSPDGEIIAGRGFWPGLCTSFKHNSKFASFVLAAKGDYLHELNIAYPFSLISAGEKDGDSIHVLPGWWFMYDMFAIVRNKYKFKSRDKRFEKIQNIEMDPFAPDTMQEVVSAVDRIVNLTAMELQSLDMNLASKAETPEELRQLAKDYLHQTNNLKFTLKDMMCQKKFGATIYKPVQAYKTYRKILKYYAVSQFYLYCKKNSISNLSSEDINRLNQLPLYKKWQNVGGQVIPEEKVKELFDLIKERKIDSWDEVHQFYDECEKNYLNYQIRYAIYLLEFLYSRSIKEFSKEILTDIKEDVIIVSNEMFESSVSSREKDYSDFFRCMTYETKEEMTEILGTVSGNSFLKQLRTDTEEFNQAINTMYEKFTL